MKAFSYGLYSLLFFFSSYLMAQSNENDAMLKQMFSAKHQAMIPVVAVADMFFACNRQRHSEKYDFQLDDLIKKMDKGQLAEKLSTCLAGESLKSDTALNFGLIGCFHAQMKGLNQQKYDEKMSTLELLLVKLPRAERQKTFTKCVSEQAIYYL